ncbi:ATP-binding protein [Streptomyces sp. NPDC048305]|uniref:ATP-binding protein n=1 Tax=Streptomyces sp. NPDC048305 TaxID=3365532 RepID=UPI003713E252
MNEPTQLSCFREAFYRRERASVPLARQFVHQALIDWEYEADHDDVLLCVSELATNALIHGVPPGRGFKVRMSWGEALRIEVHDSGGGQVEEDPAPAAPCAEYGRGLLLVGALAAAWGVGERDPGKTVWCEFAGTARKLDEAGSGSPLLGYRR